MQKNSARSIKVSAVVTAAIALVFVGCAGESTTTSDAIMAVQNSITGPAPSGLSFKEGPLHGGTAVLVGNAGYWVKDGTVYAANGFAKTWSPSLKYSPTGIDFSSVEKAVSDK